MKLCLCGCGVGGVTPNGFRHGHWNKPIERREYLSSRRTRNTRTQHGDGYITIKIFGKPPRLEHLVIAERALGRPLPKEAVVHHVNENRSDNRNQNLVICPDRTYHHLLHLRMRSIEACGRPDWRKCQICKKYSPPSDLHIPKKKGKGSIFHRACVNEYRRQLKLGKIKNAIHK